MDAGGNFYEPTLDEHRHEPVPAWLIVATILYHLGVGWFLFGSFYHKAFDQFGWDQPIAVLFAVLVGLPALSSLPAIAIFIVRGRGQAKAFAAAIVFAGTNSILFLTAGRETCFDVNQHSIRWYADSPEGRVYRSAPGVDPRTGRAFLPYTLQRADSDGSAHACVTGWMSPTSEQMRGVPAIKDSANSGRPDARTGRSATDPPPVVPAVPAGAPVKADSPDGVSLDPASLVTLLPATAAESAAAVRVSRVADFPIRTDASFGAPVIRRISGADSVYVIGSARATANGNGSDQLPIAVVIRPTAVRAAQGQAPVTVGSTVVVISNGPSGPHVSTSLNGREFVGEITTDAIDILKGSEEQWIRVAAGPQTIGFIPTRYLRQP